MTYMPDRDGTGTFELLKRWKPKSSSIERLNSGREETPESSGSHERDRKARAFLFLRPFLPVPRPGGLLSEKRREQ